MSQSTPEAAPAVSSILPASKANPDPLLNSKDAAEYIGVSPDTLSVWRSTKRYPLAYVKSGSRVFYRRSALDAFLASRTQGGGAV